MRTILITGFGPFPGAPLNPTEALVQALTRVRLPRMKIVTHVFRTSYASVDRDLRSLLRRHKPDALLMFGLAATTPHLRIETCARNVLSPLPDVAGVAANARMIAPGHAAALGLTTPARALRAATRRVCVPAAISNDAGDCNYLCWRAALAARKPGGPRLVAFIHVPEGLAAAALARAGRAFLNTVAGGRL